MKSKTIGLSISVLMLIILLSWYFYPFLQRELPFLGGKINERPGATKS